MKSTFPHHGRPLHSCNLAGSLRDGTPVHLLQPLGSLPYWEPVPYRDDDREALEPTPYLPVDDDPTPYSSSSSS